MQRSHEISGVGCPLRQQYFFNRGSGSFDDTIGGQVQKFFHMSATMPCGVRERCVAAGSEKWLREQYSPTMYTDTYPLSMPDAGSSKVPQDTVSVARTAEDAVSETGSYLPKMRSAGRLQANLYAVDQQGLHNRSKKRGSLYNTSTITENRYRRIEDLALFVNTGVITEETMYFRDPMQKRLAENAGVVAEQQHHQQCIVTVDEADPRFAIHWNDGVTENKKVTSIVPKRAKDSKRIYDQTTGSVKPYALGRGTPTAHGMNGTHYGVVENAMDTYVATMQCQRPTKGLFIPY